MPDDDAARDPVAVIRHSQEYVKRTRGLERYRDSWAKKILEEAEQEATHCIDHMIGESARAKDIHCPCDYHEEEWQRKENKGQKTNLVPNPKSLSPKPTRNGKMAAAGDEKD